MYVCMYVCLYVCAYDVVWRAEEEEAMPWAEEEVERSDIRVTAGNWTEGKLVQVM